MRPVLADVVDEIANLARLEPVVGRRPQDLQQRVASLMNIPL